MTASSYLKFTTTISLRCSHSYPQEHHCISSVSEKVSIVVDSALPFVFGPVPTTFIQAPPPPPPQKLFTEVEVNLRPTAAKAQARAEAHDEIIALKSELEESKKKLTAGKAESTASEGAAAGSYEKEACRERQMKS